MKVIRFEDASGEIRLGEPVDENRAKVIEGSLPGQWQITQQKAEVRRLLPPIVPVDIIAIGLNYRKHAEEGGFEPPAEPLIFSKLTSCVIAPGEPIVLPASAPDQVDYEAELAVVMGRTARKVPEPDALGYVLGYTCANDVSARDCQQHRDKQWTRAKSFDTFGPMGPCLLIDPDRDPGTFAIRSRLNGETVQDSNTSDLIFSVPQLISYLSHQFTLRAGTVILTGTPEGVGLARTPPRLLQPGDEITVEIEGIGQLVNPVKADN